MYRLNDKAWKILRDEVEKCTAKDDISGPVLKDMALNRLEKLRTEKGSPANYQQLKRLLEDLLPNLSEKSLKKAAIANKSGNLKKWVALLAIGGGSIASLAGLIWLVNLPYPMIRRPVAKTAPILLLPSYLSMDRNYREAIAHVEQADQLVNQATSMADFELGEKKVQQAEKNLDALPVWFLGYEPVLYCSMRDCQWKFTFDEYKAARASVGRMEAKIFQEKNAMLQMETSEVAIKQAKQDYQQTADNPEKQQTAIIAWQTGMDELTQLPPETLAGRMAQTKLLAYQRDFEQVSGYVAGNYRTNTQISAAKQFAKTATEISQKTPNSVARWEEAQNLWEKAIQELESVSLDNPGYVESRTLLASYTKNLAEINISLKTEQESVTAYEQAQTQTQQLLASLPEDPNLINGNQVMSKLQGIIYQLDKVQPGTTVYEPAQELLKNAQNKLNQLDK